MIATIVIMLVAAILTVIPDALEMVTGGRLLPIDSFQETGINFSAISLFSARFHLQRLVYHILLGGYNIDKIAKLLCFKGCSIDVNVNTHTGIGKGTGLT